MAATEETPEEAPKKKSKLPLLLGLVLAVALGGGGFYATYSGLILGGNGEQARPSVDPMPDVAFVSVTPLIISLGRNSPNRHLRFTADLEVPKAHTAEVQQLMPRILDVMNTFLRAVDSSQFEDPSALVKLRAQLLRRVQLVVGEGRVRDILVTEFVLN